MAFDGGFLYKTLAELRSDIDSHIDKIYQPSRDELVFLLRKKGFAKRLYINLRPGGARVQFTENKYENPATPPNFCMLLRKYLSSARLIGIYQPSLERIAEFSFSALNELGDTENYRLVCELLGNQSNVILLREDGRIIDALRHSDVETAKRLILPGTVYEYPPATGKLNPLECEIERILNELQGNDLSISEKLLKKIDGFSPLVCREIEYKAASIGLERALSDVLYDLKNDGRPVIVYKKNGEPLEYSYTNISQYGGEFRVVEINSFCILLDEFYSSKENAARINAAAHDIVRLVKNLYARTEKRLSLRLLELKKCENREKLRIYGELLKANLYKIKSGQEFAEVENYYDENLAKIKIPLNPALSPSKNADKYFKDYKKTYSAEQALTVLTKKDREELLYFESVLESISRCTTLSEIDEIREELANTGYIKRPAQQKKRQNAPYKYMEYFSKEGYRILVGKNNTQNDYITTKLASKNDMWFHVKGMPGSHVVVFCGGKELSDETILKAAALAAKNSKAANSSQVPVDYTPVKYVKKPNSAKPGMVVYTTNKTVFVTPSEENL
ncbi:MAG: Rqc2 family fibronectin-binding protein [Acutalibacteraceae bacterium]|jgi:predicted ribosome quality control (RQC) complex YloA/Tae2 family protein